jgi:methylphosphotriester-DNA--protein-cysteine methyltransferase
VELDDLLGCQAPLLIEQLHAAPGWNERFAIIDGVLSARLDRAPAIPPAVSGAWERLTRSSGRAHIGGLASELGWSHRHLIAQFREHIGLPPKKLARILRFERALGSINGGESICLASVAQTAGYFDQAHLHRDFRQFTGHTPAELLRRRLPGMEGLIGD